MSLGHYFDREGKPISLLQWADLQADPSYRFVADEVVNGFRVVTIWTGMDPYRSDDTDTDYDAEPPEIFETTIFVAGTLRVACGQQLQHTTEAEARACQAEFVDLTHIMDPAMSGH